MHRRTSVATLSLVVSILQVFSLDISVSSARQQICWVATDFKRRYSSWRHHHVHCGMDRAAMAADQSCNHVHSCPVLFFRLPGTDHRYHDMRLLHPEEEKNPPQPSLPNARLVVQFLERLQLACNTFMDMWMGTHDRRPHRDRSW